MGKLIGMYCEQFPVNFPTSMGKLYGMYCEQFPANFPTSMGKLYVSDVKPFLAKKVGLHEPPYLFAIQNVSL